MPVFFSLNGAAHTRINHARILRIPRRKLYYFLQDYLMLDGKVFYEAIIM